MATIWILLYQWQTDAIKIIIMAWWISTHSCSYWIYAISINTEYRYLVIKIFTLNSETNEQVFLACKNFLIKYLMGITVLYFIRDNVPKFVNSM